jgi:hypothetical protein
VPFEDSGSFSQKTRIARKTGAEAVNNQVDSTDIRQKMIADDDRYHAGKLGFGHQGTHEGWMNAETEIDTMLHDRIGKS